MCLDPLGWWPPLGVKKQSDGCRKLSKFNVFIGFDSAGSGESSSNSRNSSARLDKYYLSRLLGNTFSQTYKVYKVI